MARTDQFIDIRHGYSLFKVSIPYPAGPVKVLKPLSGGFHVLHERTSDPVFRSLKILCIAQNFFHSADAVTVYFLRQAFLKGVESFHQVFELLMCQFPGLLFVARPVETIAGSQSSKKSPLIRSLRRPQKRNSVPLSSGSSRNWSWIMKASESIPCRRSVKPVTTITRFTPAPSLSMVQHQADLIEQGI